MDIKYLINKDIDKEKWDNTIRISSNGNLYGLSWYLDTVCPKWSALISEDYKYIMPLTGNKKFGFNYLFRPLLSQQLGLFSTSPSDTNAIAEFLASIPSKYRLIQYCLNKSNTPPDIFHPINHKSFELDLGTEYEVLKSGYSENHRRNIKKAEKQEGQIRENISHYDFIESLLKDNSPGSKILAGKKNLPLLRRLLEAMHSQKAIRIIGKTNNENKLISAVLFGHSHDTWYYLAPVNSEEGKKSRALFSIIDYLIRSQSGLTEILDFEGSNIPGLAQFYRGFGSRQISYPEIRINRLPWPINYLK